MIDKSEFCDFRLDIVSNTLLECPCAVSTTIASTSTLMSSLTRSSVSPDTPTAATTLSLPFRSLQALGYCCFFFISFTVISPANSPVSSTTNNFSILCL